MAWLDRSTWLILGLLAAVVLLGACAEPTSPPPPPPSPTASAEPVSMQPTSPGEQTAPAPTSTLALLPTEEPQRGPTPTAEVGPLPALLRRISLAPADASLEDLLVDRAGGRLYASDTAGQLHILDLDGYQELAVLSASGDLTLDAEHGRLYVSPLHDEGVVSVVDVAAMALAGTIAPGGRVALDGLRNRIYVGNRIFFTPEAGTPGVRVYDGATLEKVGEIPQPGIPVYNPLRDELAIVGYTVYMADPETLQVSGDLLPEIVAQPLAWCNGCKAATAAHVYPDRNLLVVEVTTLSAGKGPGLLPPPRFFDATTLEELSDLATIPAVERPCGERLVLAAPVDGRVYRGEEYSRYVFYNNLVVQDPGGGLLTWRDGLPLGISNPRTGQMYLPHGADTLVIDLATLTPAGSLPPACIHTLEASTGQIYALWERDLLVFAERGGRAETAPTDRAGRLPAEEVAAIHLSAEYARDQTLFLVMPGKLYRSTDAGQSWARLRGGLPEGDYLTLNLAVSPAFAADRTLFAGGFRGDAWGEGVYRSVDGGETWQPAWQDLTHLRVYDVAVSPGYQTDGTVVAASRYQRLTPWEGGVSFFRLADDGLTWTLVMTQPHGADLLSPEELLPPGDPLPEVRFRAADYDTAVERTLDGGQTWAAVVVTREPQFYVKAILTSPGFAGDGTVYVLADFALFRSTDGGDTWARWRDDRLLGRDYSQKLTTAAVSPLLPDGSHQLFIGTAAGEFWSLNPAVLNWEPVQVAEPWPTVLAGTWVNEIETSPVGDVWLGSWGSGLAYYADGAIRARYTVTDGLPSQYIGGIALASDGKLWVAGDLPAGVTSFDGQTWTPHPFPPDQRVDDLFDVTAGTDGSIWAAGQAVGLRHWTGSRWETVADPQGLTGWRTNEVELDAGGTLWCATAQGLATYRNGQWSGQPAGEIEAIEFGPSGEAYALMPGGAVWRYAGGQWAELPPVKEGQFLNGLVLYAAGDGAVWLGSYDGASRFDGQAWRQFTAQEGLPANQIAAIAEDADGWLWFGTDKGAARVDPATLGLSTPTWPTPRPTPTAAAPSPTPRVAPTPAPCALAPAPAFAAVAADESIAGRLGCPAGEAVTTPAAFEPFERGIMLWRQDRRQIYALQAEGTWASYADTWEDSQPPSDATLTPPTGLQQPVRGFGKVWREQLGGPQSTLGWALAAEQRLVVIAQAFHSGLMIQGASGEVYILYSDMTWESRAQP